MSRKLTPIVLCGLASCLLLTTTVAAEPQRLPEVERQQDLLQQQRQQAISNQLIPAIPEAKLSVSKLTVEKDFPPETPCFTIKTVHLTGLEAFPGWLPLQRLADRSVDHCLGTNGISTIMRQLQNHLIDKGYVTSRVLAPEQDLTTGQLKLLLVPGITTATTLTPQSGQYIQLYTAIPLRNNKLLDSKAIEQGLENLQRLPTVKANIDIVPGKEIGASEVLVNWQQSKLWRVGLSLDDSGNRSTGKYQGAVTLYWDNPLSLSDMFYASFSHNIPRRTAYRTGNNTFSYSVPFGYWALALSGSENDYFQTVAGAFESYEYAGNSRNLALQLSRVLHRSATQKTTFSYDISGRSSRNYINDTEVEVQRRHTSAWKAGLAHHHTFSWATLDAQISYQRGTRWFGAQPAPEEYRASATALSKITQFNVQLDLPFTLWQQQFHYQTQYRHQTTTTPLTPQDQFSLGGRWTVRGFDGESSLTANKGWFVRNDLVWQTPLLNASLYLGADYGEVYGKGSEWLVGQHLAGGVIGLKGNLHRLNYDLFVGRPLSKPAKFNTSATTYGFNFNWQF